MNRVWPVVVLVGLAVVAGYLLGSWRSSPRLTDGVAHSVEQQVSIEAGSWTYAMPLDVAWRAADGTWNGGGRPECVPPSDSPIEDVTFAYVDASFAGVGWRPVVWVDCQ